jgi:hypothetical protein
MSIKETILGATAIPHLLSRVDPATKAIYKNKYKKVKKLSSISAIAVLTSISLKELVRDIASSKVKAYGYKTAIAFLGGPILQVFAVPL